MCFILETKASGSECKKGNGLEKARGREGQGEKLVVGPFAEPAESLRVSGSKMHGIQDGSHMVPAYRSL